MPQERPSYDDRTQSLDGASHFGNGGRSVPDERELSGKTEAMPVNDEASVDDLSKSIAADFRRNVDRIRLVAEAAENNLAVQVFAPDVRGDDGVTMTVWRDDAAMTAFAYRAGHHRDEVGRYKRHKTADRTSFTRLRSLGTSGTWHGSCPVESARAMMT